MPQSPYTRAKLWHNPFDTRAQSLLANFEKLAHSAMKSIDSSANERNRNMVQDLHDNLFSFRTFIRNIKTMGGTKDMSFNRLQLLDIFQDSKFDLLKEIWTRLEQNIKSMTSELSDTSIVSHEFTQAYEGMRTSLSELDKLDDELLPRIKTAEAKLREMIKNGNVGTTVSSLCLDGGGVRSYSSLLVLDALMEEIQSQAQNWTDGNGNIGGELRPCKGFDYVFGSSSGGLIAIVLGRLNMSIDQCMKAFERHLNYILKKLIKEFDPTTENQKLMKDMFAAPDASCGCGVIAHASPGERSVTDDHFIFRTYDNHDGDLNPGRASVC